MRHHFYTMLFGAFVLASAFGEADPFNSNGDEVQTETTIEEESQTQEPNVGEVDGEGTQSETTEDQIGVFFGENAGRSEAGTEEEILLETTNDEPSPAENVETVDTPAEEIQPNQQPNVGDDSAVETDTPAEEIQPNQQPNVGDDSPVETDTPAEEIQPKTDVDQEPTMSHPPKDVGFFEMIRSFFSVFTESASPSPVQVSNPTPRTVGRYFFSHDSDEDSHSFEDDDISDEMPMPVQLAQIKQFVRTNTPTDRVRTDQHEAHPVVNQAAKQHVVGRSQTPAPSSRSVYVITDSDEYDYDHSYEQDMSLEVDYDLLPEIRRFLEPTIGHGEVINHYEEPGGGLLMGTQDILENPIFQQKMQEIDNRLKRASGANGKRLMEKYAEALAVHSTPSLNMASTSVTFSCFLPFFITCLLARLS
ncbi:uncharacterized protein LOC116919239 isoform X1 [Daphnia magna]|uniref:uncharacterized protein LOC116919239 isoform X1 n=1 Tax=Daphnia magna TaxID=35525 RepID=UPI001E1BD201|nr:uncharacterized protein LOC116919239 isoform X1 [Daphnia magna]